MKKFILYPTVVLIGFCLGYLIMNVANESQHSIVNVNRIEAIGSPSGIPVIIYDPDRNRIMINTKNLPNGLDICIDGVCERDIHWRAEK